MRYLEPVYRPPSEAESFILQVTYGCSHNECTFCEMYRDKPFKTRRPDEVLEDICEVSRRYPDVRRVFLADGDAMVLKATKLYKILDWLNEYFPALERVGIYTDAKGVNLKTDEELIELRKRKLSMVYIGLESGSDLVLKKIKKGAGSGEMIMAMQRARAAGIETSVIALLGIGGKDLSEEHALKTAQVVSAMAPDYFSALTLTITDGTELAKEVEQGVFRPLSPEESLRELRSMIESITSARPIVFRTNHASNYVPLKGVLPSDKAEMLRTIDWALEHKVLRPEWMRGL